MRSADVREYQYFKTLHASPAGVSGNSTLISVLLCTDQDIGAAFHVGWVEQGDHFVTVTCGYKIVIS